MVNLESSIQDIKEYKLTGNLICGTPDCLSKYFKAEYDHTIKHEKGLKSIEIKVYHLKHCCNCEGTEITIQCPECKSLKRYYDSKRNEYYCAKCGLVFD